MENIFHLAREAINDGVVEATLKERQTHWHNWKNWLSLNATSIDNLLKWDTVRNQQLSRREQIDLLAAYCCHVRYRGNIRGSKTVRALTVAVALRSTATKCQLDAEFNIVEGTEN